MYDPECFEMQSFSVSKIAKDLQLNKSMGTCVPYENMDTKIDL